MTDPAPRRQFLDGLRHGAPFLLVTAPFALLFGVIATEAGLSLAEVMGFSVLVIAGAAQFTALQLMNEHAPTVIVLASALAVNLRMAMYSASLAPWLGASPLWLRAIAAYVMFDQNYALSLARYESRPQMTLSERWAYYFGAVVLIAPTWFVLTYAGAVIGKGIPPAFALDFAVPITFLALVGPALRTPAHVAAAMVSMLLGVALAWMPYNLGLLVAAAAAIATGAEVERRLEERGTA